MKFTATTTLLAVLVAAMCITPPSVNAFSVVHHGPRVSLLQSSKPFTRVMMSESDDSASSDATVSATTPPTDEGESASTLPSSDPMEMEEMDADTLLAMEKARRAQELREQEVFMQKSTGKHICGNCDWVYDESKGDSMMIGGMIKPDTPFAELPSNWRCPVCRASKDSFQEEVVEIPGFAVNQGYGFGGNAMTGEQKTGVIFGGLGFFFLLFLSGYAMS